MKISKKDQILLLALVGVLLAALSYFLVFKPYTEKKDNLNKENDALQVRVDELQVLMDNKDEYIRKTEEMNTEIDGYYAKFPADVKTEDMIMLGVNLADNSPLQVTSLDMREAVDIHHIGEGIVVDSATTDPNADPNAAPADPNAAPADPNAAPADPNADPNAATAPAEEPIILYAKQFGLAGYSTYDGFKNALQAICTSEDRRNIDTINAMYDSTTGLVAMNLGLSMYYLTGTDKAYVEPNIPFVPQGTDNIFGTLESLEAGLNQAQEPPVE